MIASIKEFAQDAWRNTRLFVSRPFRWFRRQPLALPEEIVVTTLADEEEIPYAELVEEEFIVRAISAAAKTQFTLMAIMGRRYGSFADKVVAQPDDGSGANTRRRRHTFALRRRSR